MLGSTRVYGQQDNSQLLKTFLKCLKTFFVTNHVYLNIFENIFCHSPCISKTIWQRDFPPKIQGTRQKQMHHLENEVSLVPQQRKEDLRGSTSLKCFNLEVTHVTISQHIGQIFSTQIHLPKGLGHGEKMDALQTVNASVTDNNGF